MESLRQVSESMAVSITSTFFLLHMLQHTTGRGGVVLDGLALAVESIVLWTKVGLQSPLSVTAESREGGTRDAGGEHRVGVGEVVDRWVADALVTPSL